MERELMSALVAWKEKKRRKPLILWGARQVGKTWIMREFGKNNFKDFVYISFYNNKRIAAIFEQDYDVKRIIRALEIEMHVKITPGQTLLIFDEVQSAMRVVESLKYFCEDASEYYVIAAGSLLGVAMHEGISFPVGKVDELHLFPLSFREYLRARGEKELAAFLSDWKNAEVNDFEERYKEYLREYFYIGGMPEVVATFCENRDFSEAREIQNTIIQQYEGDFGKHAPLSLLPRIRMTWNAIPMQLAKENKKFFFGQIKKGARMSDFELAIQWLADAGLIYKVNKVTKPGIPLKAYVDFSAFKIFMIDVGLLGALSELDYVAVLRGTEIFTEFKGALTEQYVLQQLVSATEYTPYYYAGEKSTFETDFLIQKNGDVLPVEVKAEENLKSKSLRVYCDKFQPAYGIRTSMAKAKKQDWMINIPLWAIETL